MKVDILRPQGHVNMLFHIAPFCFAPIKGLSAHAYDLLFKHRTVHRWHPHTSTHQACRRSVSGSGGRADKCDPVFLCVASEILKYFAFQQFTNKQIVFSYY